MSHAVVNFRWHDGAGGWLPRRVRAYHLGMLPLPLRIAIIGDFDADKLSHWATDAALHHAGAQARQALDVRWVGTSRVSEHGPEESLAAFDGIWGAPGSPFASVGGMLAAIRFAREQDVPYLGTCAGFQYALIEFTRNVLGLLDADTAENESSSSNIVITPVSCPLPGRPVGAPKLAGMDEVIPVAGTLLGEICGTAPLAGEYFCNFETNADYVERWRAAGLAIAARDRRGEMRALSLPSRRFFIATLFQPQRASRAGAPHAIVEAFLRACAAR
jgi:CTP synthase (UTP-ammonia lyase)